MPDYRLAVTYPAAAEAAPAARPEIITDDPYRYLPTLGEIDLHLIGEGRHEELWRVLGAHRQFAGRAASGRRRSGIFAERRARRSRSGRRTPAGCG